MCVCMWLAYNKILNGQDYLRSKVKSISKSKKHSYLRSARSMGIRVRENFDVFHGKGKMKILNKKKTSEKEMYFIEDIKLSIYQREVCF